MVADPSSHHGGPDEKMVHEMDEEWMVGMVGWWMVR
jgi:hypothetical protein